MMRRAALVVLLLLIGTVAPAQAREWSGDDARGDADQGWVGEDNPPLCSPDATVGTAGDIRWISVKHGPLRVTLRAGLDGRLDHVEFDIRTSRGEAFVVQVTSNARRDVVTVHETDRLADVECGRDEASSTRVRCPGATNRFPGRHVRASASIPRRCLGSPMWVRVGATAGSDDRTNLTWDQWENQDHVDADHWVARVFGPWVRSTRH